MAWTQVSERDPNAPKVGGESTTEAEARLFLRWLFKRLRGRLK